MAEKRYLGRLNAFTTVANLNADLPRHVIVRCQYPNVAALSEFAGVFDEVDQHLFESKLVALQLVGQWYLFHAIKGSATGHIA